ncbi:alpha/beta hydrolase [Streptomyces sp. NBC_01602]|uniref:alpha/beta hydrolase n=1 Tax=Streptomyces sp. NBC_01602 TaxID=2975893 RepID=UPI00386C5D9F|nr:alpha/beta hydrolase [Streptomyces sp. NBC_01602]
MEDGDAGQLYVTAPDGATIAAEVIVPARPAVATLLLVPGLGYGPWSWAPQRVEFAAGYQLVLLHNRGTGQSDAPSGPYSIDTLADDAAAVLRALGSPPTHVVGTSMGGYVSLQLAAAHPDLVASVVVIASSPGGAGAPLASQQPEAAARDVAVIAGQLLASGRHLTLLALTDNLGPALDEHPAWRRWTLPRGIGPRSPRGHRTC